MPRSKSFFRRYIEGGEGMFFPSETKVQNSSKYKAHECELKARLEDLRVKHRDFIRKTHTEVLELKQFLNDVQKLRPVALDLKRIDRRHRRRRLIAKTETEMVQVRVDNQLVNLPVLVLKKPDKSEERPKKHGHSRDDKRKRRRSSRNVDEGKRQDSNLESSDEEKHRSKVPLPGLPEEPSYSEEGRKGSDLPNIDPVRSLTTSSFRESRVPTREKKRSNVLPSQKDKKKFDLRRPASLPDLLLMPTERNRETEAA